MGLLKAFVIGSGVVLVVGTIMLAAVIITRAISGSEDPEGAQAIPAAVELELPAGARVEQVIPDDDRVLLLGSQAGGRQFLAVIDPETGERLRLIRFRTAP